MTIIVQLQSAAAFVHLIMLYKIMELMFFKTPGYSIKGKAQPQSVDSVKLKHYSAWYTYFL